MELDIIQSISEAGQTGVSLFLAFLLYKIVKENREYMQTKNGQLEKITERHQKMMEKQENFLKSFAKDMKIMLKSKK